MLLIITLMGFRSWMVLCVVIFSWPVVYGFISHGGRVEYTNISKIDKVDGQDVMHDHKWKNRDEHTGLEIMVSVSKSAYHPDESIEIFLLIRNDSAESADIYVPGLLGQIRIISNADSPNSPRPQSHPLVFGRIARNDETDNIALDPNEMFGRRFVADSLPLGDFEVAAMYKVGPEAKNYLIIVESSRLKVVNEGE